MSGKKRIKAPALPTPQSREETDAAIRRVGELQRELERIETEMNERLAAAKADAELLAQPAKAELKGRAAAIQAWCEANRDELTEGKTKTVRFGAGEVSWRTRPPKVSLRGVEEIIETCLRWKGFDRFLRVKHEIDKEAMQKEPAVATKIPGVSIGSEGEDFAIKPFETQLEEVT